VLLLAAAQLPGYFSAAWLVERWGRKRTFARGPGPVHAHAGA
jgi:hypothetical protein